MWFQTGMPHQSGDEISDGGEGQVGSAPAVTLVVPSIMSELGLSSSGGKLAATANAPLVQVGNGRPSQLCMCTSPTGNGKSTLIETFNIDSLASLSSVLLIFATKFHQ